MGKQNSKPVRINKDFEDFFRRAALERFRKGVDLDNKPRTLPEMTKMAMNAPSIKQLERELTSIKLKKDLEKLRRVTRE